MKPSPVKHDATILTALGLVACVVGAASAIAGDFRLSATAWMVAYLSALFRLYF